MKFISSATTQPARMSTPFITGLIVCILVAGVSCKKSDSPTSPPDTNGGGANVLGAGTPGTPVTDAQRFAAFDTVRQKFKGFSGPDNSTVNQLVAAYLRTMTVFDAAGVSADGAVWAHFTDDRTLIFSNNRPVNEPPQELPRAKSPDGAEQTTELPQSRKARVLRGLGTVFYDNTPKIKEMLTKNGYVISGEDATVDGLTQVSGDGVVYFETHGGSGDIMKYANGRLNSVGVMFSLLTTTPVTQNNDLLYASYLQNKLLTYFLAENDTDVFGNKTASLCYGITAEFVKQKMSFGPNSLVFMNACGSFNPDFWKACVGKKAEEYVGWSDAIVSMYAIHASRYLFSRLLGETEFVDPEDPPQRPFELTLVKADMAGPNVSGSDLTKFPNPTYDGPNVGYTYLMFAPLNPGFTLCAPSIEHLEVDESVPALTLYGYFGTEPGSENDRKVTVDGVPRTISQWTNEMIVCDIPKFGPGSAGDVIVTAYGHVSNTVQLTEWRGTVTYNQPSLGSLGEFYSFDLHFRADAHTFRKKPHETPKAVLESDFGLMEDSKGQFNIGGEAAKTCPPDHGCVLSGTEIWTPSQLSIPYGGFVVSAGTSFYTTIAFKPQENKLNLIMLGGISEGLHSSYVTKTVCGSTTETSEVDDTFGSNTVVPPQGYIPLDMADNYVIRSGHMDINHAPKGRIAEICGDPPGTVVYTITWTNFTPTHPPETDAAR